MEYRPSLRAVSSIFIPAIFVCILISLFSVSKLSKTAIEDSLLNPTVALFNTPAIYRTSDSQTHGANSGIRDYAEVSSNKSAHLMRMQ